MSLKSKRYTYSKLRRSLLNILLNIELVDIIKIMSTNSGYVKVLSFNNTGRKAIKNATSSGTKVINRYSDYKKYNLIIKLLTKHINNNESLKNHLIGHMKHRNMNFLFYYKKYCMFLGQVYVGE